jgi:GT2 family glycosyltransferase
MSRWRTAAVVVDWGRPDDTLLALRSLAAMTPPPDHLICVENGSPPEGVARVTGLAPEGTEIVRLERNAGLAGGANAGIDHAVRAGADWVLLLNNDAQVDRHCLSRCLDDADLHPRTAIVGPAIVYADRPDTLWYAGGALGARTLLTRHRGLNLPAARRGRTGKTDYVSGCCAVISAAAWREIGPFASELFAYYEDAEWCLRARQAGWACRYLGEVLCRHAVGSSTGVSGSLRLNPTTAYYLARNPFKVALDTPSWPLRLLRLVSLGIVWNVYNAGRLLRARRLDVGRAYVDGLGDAWRGRMGARASG